MEDSIAPHTLWGKLLVTVTFQMLLILGGGLFAIRFFFNCMKYQLCWKNAELTQFQGAAKNIAAITNKVDTNLIALMLSLMFVLAIGMLLQKQIAKIKNIPRFRNDEPTSTNMVNEMTIDNKEYPLVSEPEIAVELEKSENSNYSNDDIECNKTEEVTSEITNEFETVGGESEINKETEQDATIFNKAAFMDRIDGMEDSISEFIDVFVETVGKTLPKLEAALNLADCVAAAKIAHMVKGSSANICAERIFAAAKAVEIFARNEDVQSAKTATLDLILEFKAFLKEVKRQS